ncbi:LysR family transcriptional regulator [Vibrio sp. WXL210]|uniref:LysR family transcriptional regulator n=1 Tax=Vibrio sp. WXL210 TaxID=3450709 RepID=UPI003EC8B7B6
MSEKQKRIDLNLLTAFVTTYEEKKLRQAAKKLHITAPSLSVKISKLNDYFGETLFVKSPSGFLPTPFADSLYERVNGLLSSLESEVQQAGAFDPSELDETIKISIGRHQIPWLTPRLYRAVKRVAPKARLIVNPYISEHLSDLLCSDTEMVIELDRPSQKIVSSTEVGTHETWFAVRKDHPLEGTVTLKELLKYEFALVHDSALPIGVTQALLKKLASMEMDYTIGISSPSFEAIVDILIHSDAVSPMYKNSVLQHSDKLKVIQVTEHDFRLEHPIYAYVHKKNRYSKKHQWLIDVVRKALVTGES